MPTIQKIHNIFIVNKYSLRFPERFTSFLVSFELENKPKKRSAFDYKYQISLENSSQNESLPVNRYLSMRNLRAASKFLSELISYLSGKNIIAMPDISQKSGSEVAA